MEGAQHMSYDTARENLSLLHNREICFRRSQVAEGSGPSLALEWLQREFLASTGGRRFKGRRVADN